MSDVKRFNMPWHDDPMDWPRELRAPGTPVVLASDYDALRAERDRLREALDKSLANCKECDGTGGWEPSYEGDTFTPCPLCGPIRAALTKDQP